MPVSAVRCSASRRRSAPRRRRDVTSTRSPRAAHAVSRSTGSVTDSGRTRSGCPRAGRAAACRGRCAAARRPRPPAWGPCEERGARGPSRAARRRWRARESTTNAVTASPHSGSATPATPHRPRRGERAAPRSTSRGDTFSPPVTISSLSRPSTCRRPSSSMAQIAGVQPAVRREGAARHHRRRAPGSLRRRPSSTRQDARARPGSGPRLRAGLGHPVDGDTGSRRRAPSRAGRPGSARRAHRSQAATASGRRPEGAQHRRHERSRDLARLERVAHALGVEALVQHGGGGVDRRAQQHGQAADVEERERGRASGRPPRRPARRPTPRAGRRGWRS